MGFTGDNGGFSFGVSSAQSENTRPTHGRKHSHRRHSSVSTRSHSMQLMSGNLNLLDDDELAGPSISPSIHQDDESALNNGFVDASNSSSSSSNFLVMPTSAQLEQLSGQLCLNYFTS